MKNLVSLGAVPVRRILSRLCSITALVTVLFGVGVKNTRAYDNDTHFWLTYYLAVKAEFTPHQATQIASANISVDLDLDTEPILGNLVRGVLSVHPLTNAQKVRGRFHALPRRKDLVRKNDYPRTHWWDPIRLDLADNEPYRKHYLQMLIHANAMVSDRLNEFWEETLSANENPGVFLHYLQDSFAHKGFLSYIGHIGYDYVDFVATDRDKAKLTARSTLQYLKAFHQFHLKWISISESLNPSLIVLTTDEIAEIDQVVDRMAEVNPSKGLTENRVFEAWENISNNDRKKRHRGLTFQMAQAIASIAGNTPSPDSSRAKRVVLGVLPDTTEVPLIWQFDLRKSGKPSREYTTTAFQYMEQDPAPSSGEIFVSADEKRNWEAIKRIRDHEGRFPCLYFKLDDNAGSAPKTCKSDR